MTKDKRNRVAQWAHRRLTASSARSQMLLSIGLLVVPNLVAWVLFFPGYFQADHQRVIGLISQGDFQQWHSLVWGFFAYPFLYLSPSYAVYGLVQIGVFASLAFFSIRKMHVLQIVKSPVPLSAFFGLFPPFLMYNELYCSDMCFAYVMLYVTALVIELVETQGKVLGARGYCVQLVCFVTLLICLRKNGLIVAVGLIVCLPFVVKHGRKLAAGLVAAALALGICIDSVVFPVLLHATPSPSQEMLSVPSTQIARVFAVGGEIPEGLDTILRERTAQEWARAYNPNSADEAKKGQQLSAGFISDWITLGLHNPKEYLYAYLELEYPFWIFGDAPYSQIYVDFSATDYFTYDAVGENVRPEYLAQFTGEEGKSRAWHLLGGIDERINALHIPVVTDLANALFFNRGLPLWTVVVGLVLTKRGKRRYFLCACMPVLALMLGLLAFAPIAMMRYAMQAYYALPLLWVYFAHRTSRWAPCLDEA